MNPARCRVLRSRPAGVLADPSGDVAKTVLYWVTRDMRAEHNWALIHAQELAAKSKARLAVLFVLTPDYERFTWRHYHFLVKSLREFDKDLRRKNIPLFVIESASEAVPQTVISVAEELKSSALLCDFNPLRTNSKCLDDVVQSLERNGSDIEVRQVDAHNVVPVWVASQKLEWAARTIRPKIHSAMNIFMDSFPLSTSMATDNLTIQPGSHKFYSKDRAYTNDWQRIENESSAMKSCNRAVEPVDDFFPPGTRAAKLRLDEFLCEEGIGQQSTRRNDPNYSRVLSGLSSYLNFGLISAQYIVQRVSEFDVDTGKKHHKDCEAFLEELVVRRELSDNFCFYNPLYDELEGAPEWAQITLKQHIPDRRDHNYTLDEWERCATHDPIWNASMMQLRKEGKMHGFLRMYWAKKLLEWSASPQLAIEFAIHLNDRWALDGNNPNGFVGIMWSICGVHDQGFAERAVFGKVRYMNESGCKRKFDVKAFCARYPANIPSNGPHLMSNDDNPSKTALKPRPSIEALIEGHKKHQKGSNKRLRPTEG